MSYSEETMNRISRALAGGALPSTGADRASDTPDESEAVSNRFPKTGVIRSSELGDDWSAEHHLRDEFRIEDTCCGKCPMGTTCYVDQITGA